MNPNGTTPMRERPFKQYLQFLWWILINEKRFRVMDTEDRFTKLMTYGQAKACRNLFGGQLVVDFNNKLLP